MMLSSKATATTWSTSSSFLRHLSSCHRGGPFGRSFSSSSTKQTDQEQQPLVETTIDEYGICRVTLNRPNKLNAMNLPMFEAVAETASQLRNNPNIRAVILNGKGRAFCTGLDVKSVMKNPITNTKRLLERPSGYGSGKPSDGNEKNIGNLAQDVCYLWRTLPVPVIAVLHGMCFGAGLQIALGADFRYATLDCQFSIMEGKWGLIPDMGASIFLREVIRLDHAKELTMTGRIITGKEAAQIGLITSVVNGGENDDDESSSSSSSPMEYAEKLAVEIVQRSPDAIASAKELYQRTWNEPSEAKCLKIETELQEKLLISFNQMAASGRAFGLGNVPYTNRKK